MAFVELSGFHLNALVKLRVVVPSYSVDVMLYVLAFVRLSSLHGYCACRVFWVKEALRESCRQHI